MIDPGWIKLPISRTNFHWPKDVWVTEVWLYCIVFVDSVSKEQKSRWDWECIGWPGPLLPTCGIWSLVLIMHHYPHACVGDIVIASVRLSVRPYVRYAISSQTAGQNPTKFGEWLAYTSWACKSTFIFGPTPRGPGERSKGQILTSVGICDGVPSTAQSSIYFLWAPSICDNIIAPANALFSTKNYWYFSYFSMKRCR